jgi:hypothetical protein
MALVFAVTACHVQFSVHKFFRDSPSLDIARQYELRAREHIQLSDKTISSISLIQALCFLIEHAANQGDGHQAWMDIG